MDTIKEWLTENKEYIPWGIVAALLIFLLASSLAQDTEDEMDQSNLPEELFYEEESDRSEQAQVEETSSEETEESENNEPQHIFVDIKGAVQAPGVYEMANGDRLVDLIDKAQGFNEEADPTQINLAQKIEDQMMVYIPKEGEVVEENLMPAPPASDSAEISGKQEGVVNINTADISGLMSLNGIGEKKAQSILDYREENGSFQTIEDIKNISGIGDKSFENIKDSITVSD